jgi:hypothetical protein
VVGDWRDEMQVKHDAKTIQERRAATSVQLRTVKGDIRTHYLLAVLPSHVILKAYDTIIQHNTIRVQYHTPHSPSSLQAGLLPLTPTPGPGHHA